MTTPDGGSSSQHLSRAGTPRYATQAEYEEHIARLEQEALEARQNANSALNSNATTQAAMQELQSRLSEAQVRVAQLEAHQMPPPPPVRVPGAAAASSSSSSSRLKPVPPAPYSGDGEPAKRSTLAKMFIRRCETYFFLKGGSITDAERIRFAVSYLTGTAATWWYLLDGKPAMPATWHEFTTALYTQFEPPNDKYYVQIRQRKLYQHGALINYVNAFELGMSQLDIDLSIPAVNHLMTVDFINGLRPELRDRVLDSDHCFDYSKVRALAYAHEANQNLMGRNSRAYSSTSKATFKAAIGAAPSASGPTPMELGAAQLAPHNANNQQFRPRLTAEQKAERRAKNLCLYCGGANHKLANCPYRKPRPFNSGR